jgi:hypothetical protein
MKISYGIDVYQFWCALGLTKVWAFGSLLVRIQTFSGVWVLFAQSLA